MGKDCVSPCPVWREAQIDNEMKTAVIQGLSRILVYSLNLPKQDRIGVIIIHVIVIYGPTSLDLVLTQ